MKYGKPEKKTFDFAKQRLQKAAEDADISISNFYMIGDNPHADIKGGNDNECETILVRTGVWHGYEDAEDGSGRFRLENDAENPATYVVDDM